jgi:hypothetical protein
MMDEAILLLKVKGNYNNELLVEGESRIIDVAKCCLREREKKEDNCCSKLFVEGSKTNKTGCHKLFVER